MKNKCKNWWILLLVFLAWLSLLLTAAYIFTQDKILPYSPSYPLSKQIIENAELAPMIRRWGGFDGVHYLTIVNQGYKEVKGVQAFFPLYWILIDLSSYISHQPLLNGLIISSLSFYGFLWLSFKFVKEKYSAKIAWWWIAIFLFLPGSFFFQALYNESLFLLLLMATFYAYDKKKYWLVAVFGILLSATKIVGIVAPAVLTIDFLIKAYQDKRFKEKKTWLNLLLIAGGSLGLLAYMNYLWSNFQDPLYFMTVQKSFGSGRETSRLISLLQVFWRYVKMFYYGLPLNLKTYTIIQELLVTIFYLIGLIVTAVQNIKAKKEIYPWTWWLVSLVIFIIPTLTGNFSSMIRYVLPCIVVVLWLAKTFAREKLIGYLFLLITSSIMFFNLLMFLQGFWVA